MVATEAAGAHEQKLMYKLEQMIVEELMDFGVETGYVNPFSRMDEISLLN